MDYASSMKEWTLFKSKVTDNFYITSLTSQNFIFQNITQILMLDILDISRDIICLEFPFKKKVSWGNGEAEVMGVGTAISASEWRSFRAWLKLSQSEKWDV